MSKGRIVFMQQVETEQQRTVEIPGLLSRIEESFNIYVRWPTEGGRSVQGFLDWVFTHNSGIFDIIMTTLYQCVRKKVLYHIILTLPFSSSENKRTILESSFESLNTTLVEELCCFGCLYMVDVDAERVYHIHVIALTFYDILQLYPRLKRAWSTIFSGGDCEIIAVKTNEHSLNLIKYFIKKLALDLDYKHYNLPLFLYIFFWIKELLEKYILILDTKARDIYVPSLKTSQIGTALVSLVECTDSFNTENIYNQIKSMYLDVPKHTVCSQIEIEKITQANVVKDVYSDPSIPISYRNIMWFSYYLYENTCDKFIVEFEKYYSKRNSTLRVLRVFFKRRRQVFLRLWFKEFYSACIVCVLKAAASERKHVDLLEDIHTQLLIRLKYVLKTNLAESFITAFIGNIKIAECFFDLTSIALSDYVRFSITNKSIGLGVADVQIRKKNTPVRVYFEWVCDTALELSVQKILALHKTQAKIKYPLVCKPKPWQVVDTPNGFVAEGGGYLCNGLLYDFPLVIPSKGFKHHLYVWDREVIDVINYLQTISFVRDMRFDAWLRDYLAVPSKTEWVAYSKGVMGKLSKINLRLQDLSNKDTESVIRSTHLKTNKEGVRVLSDSNSVRVLRYKNLRRRIQTGYSERLLVREYLDGMETISGQSNIFYFTYFYDFRGRLYSHSLLHPQNCRYARSSLRFSSMRLFDEKSFVDAWMQLYRKGSSRDSAVLFESLREELGHGVDINNKLINPENVERFVAYWFEYIKYLKSKKEKSVFFTNLICYLDATSSGPQLLSLLSQDVSFAVELHLVDTTYAGDFYIAIVDQICESYCFEQVASEAEVSLQTKLLTLKNTVGFSGLRSLLKRSVMTEFYGCTKRSFINYMRDGAKKVKDLLVFTKEEFRVFAQYAYLKTRDLSLISIKLLITNIVDSVMTQQKGFTWNVMNKYTVRMHYTKNSVKRVTLNRVSKRLATPAVRKKIGKRVQKLNIAVVGSSLFRSKMRNACVPNIIQSFDALVLHYLIASAQLANKPIVCIHDCIGCHFEDVGWFKGEIQDIYRKIYDADILYEEFMKKLPPNLRHLRGTLRKFKRAGFDALRKRISSYGFVSDNVLSSSTDEHIRDWMCYSNNIYEFED